VVAVPRRRIPQRMVGRSCAFSGSIALALPSNRRVAREDRNQPGTPQSAAVQLDLDRVNSAARLRDGTGAFNERSLPVDSFASILRTSELLFSALFRRPVQSLIGQDPAAVLMLTNGEADERSGPAAC
jgi:hypothetical protein